jgi:hypothetical protein
MDTRVITIKELRRQQERIKRVKRIIGASAVDCKTDKIKALFEMFGRA